MVLYQLLGPVLAETGLSYEKVSDCTVKPVLSGHLKIDKIKVLMEMVA